MAVIVRIAALVAGYSVYALTAWGGSRVYAAVCFSSGPCGPRTDVSLRIGFFGVSLWLGIRIYRRIVRDHAPAPTWPPGTRPLVLFGLAAVSVVLAGVAASTCGGCGTGEGHVRMMLPLLLAAAFGVAGMMALVGSLRRHPAPRVRPTDHGPSPLETFMALDRRPTADSWQEDVRKHRDE